LPTNREKTHKKHHLHRLPLLLSTASSSFAGSATWLASPATGDWNTASNWAPATVPNGSSDTATFGFSNTTGVSTAGNTEANGIVFNAGASAFTITATPTLTLTISGTGITNNSGITQNFVTAVNGAGNVGEIVFTNSATAGSLTAFTNNGSAVSGFGGGALSFNSTSTAGNGTFTNNGGVVSGAGGGTTIFFFSSTAGNGTLIANGGSGGGAGGLIQFVTNSTGGTARVEVFGNGNLDMSFHAAPGMAVGSIEGNGIVFLGANNLTVGGNKLSTTFSGVMQDGGGNGGTGGSLTKIGKGKLSLTKANTYTGGTTLKAGSLLVKNKTGSATGTGAVQVNAGTLGGTGKIAGAVTVGTGSGAGAFVSPGTSATKPGTLTINNNTLTFNSD